jgi:hypothetical protein
MWKPDKKTTERFDSLIKTCRENLRNLVIENGHGTVIVSGGGLPMTINAERTVRWGLNSLNLISSVFGESSTYYKRFDEIYPKFSLEENREDVKRALAILLAAKDAYEKGFHVIEKQEIVVTDVETRPNELETILAKDANRNARVYLGVASLIFIFICSALFYVFGIGIASIITFGLLIICYSLSALSLKEWTPTKLPERVLELEKSRIYKKFGVDTDKV